jgi:hypothetical protein
MSTPALTASAFRTRTSDPVRLSGLRVRTRAAYLRFNRPDVRRAMRDQCNEGAVAMH